MNDLHWETDEMERVGVDLSEAPGRMQRRAPKVFGRGALEIKNRIQIDATGHDFLEDLPRHVSYDRLALLEYEIGFEKVGQGNLAVFAVFGSVNNAPVMESPVMAARREIPSIERHLGNEGEDAVLGGRE